MKWSWIVWDHFQCQIFCLICLLYVQFWFLFINFVFSLGLFIFYFASKQVFFGSFCIMLLIIMEIVIVLFVEITFKFWNFAIFVVLKVLVEYFLIVLIIFVIRASIPGYVVEELLIVGTEFNLSLKLRILFLWIFINFIFI